MQCWNNSNEKLNYFVLISNISYSITSTYRVHKQLNEPLAVTIKQ